MKKKILRNLLIAIVVSSIFIPLSGAKKMKKVTVTISADDTWWGGSKDQGLQSAVIREIEKAIGITVAQIMPIRAQYNQKLNLLLTSGDKPDIMWIQKAMNYVPTYTVRGDIIPLDQYIKKSPLASVIDPSVYDYIKIKGKTYYIPINRPSSKNIWLRKDLVDKYGIKLSSTPTTEEFITEMKKIVAKDKNVVPLSFPKFIDNFQYFYNSFGAYDKIYQKNGKYIDGFNTPEMKEALLYIKRLYDEGILDKQFITNEENKMRQNLSKGLAVGDIDSYSSYSFYIDESMRANSPSDFIPIYKLVGPKGMGGSYNEAIQDAWAISNTCKNPDVAFKFIEWQVFNSAGRQMTSIGIKGLHFDTDRNGVASAKEVAASTGYTLSPDYIFNSFPDFSDKGFKWAPQITRSLPRQVEIAQESLKHLGPAYASPDGQSVLFDRLSPSIKKKREETAVAIVKGTKTLDVAFKDYDNFWRSVEGAKMLTELNK